RGAAASAHLATQRRKAGRQRFRRYRSGVRQKPAARRSDVQERNRRKRVGGRGVRAREHRRCARHRQLDARARRRESGVLTRTAYVARSFSSASNALCHVARSFSSAWNALCRSRCVYHRRPPRLPSFDYRGRYRYFVTCCSRDRRHVFTLSTIVSGLAGEILRTCDQHAFEVIAYVFMPDHLHMLLNGCSDIADFRAAMTVIRQRSAVAFRRETGQALWQDGYFERVLRREEQTVDVVRTSSGIL